MKKTIFCFVLLSVFVISGVAQATWYSESQIYPYTPDIGVWKYDISTTAPTHASFNSNLCDKEIDTYSGWWELGGSSNTTWDSDYEGPIYFWTFIEKEFEVTAEGKATISFTWNGFLDVEGNPIHNGDFDFETNLNITDDKNWNPDIDWYYWTDSIGNLPIDENDAYTYVFSEADAINGTKFGISVWFDVGLYEYDPDITGDDRLKFASNFDKLFGNGLDIQITGGIQAVDGDDPPAVPIPGAAWLFGSVILGIVGVRRKNKKQ